LPTVEATIQRLGLDTLLPLRESDGPTLFCFHPASGFAWQFRRQQRLQMMLADLVEAGGAGHRPLRARRLNTGN
jgi:hypothetical protein